MRHQATISPRREAALVLDKKAKSYWRRQLRKGGMSSLGLMKTMKSLSSWNNILTKLWMTLSTKGKHSKGSSLSIDGRAYRRQIPRPMPGELSTITTTIKTSWQRRMDLGSWYRHMNRRASNFKLLLRPTSILNYISCHLTSLSTRSTSGLGPKIRSNLGARFQTSDVNYTYETTRPSMSTPHSPTLVWVCLDILNSSVLHSYQEKTIQVLPTRQQLSRTSVLLTKIKHLPRSQGWSC